MKTNKFRVRDKVTKKMLIPEGNTTENGSRRYYLNGGVSIEGCWVGCDEKELMQYIGLEDKNGKEIYEGDIVKSEDGTIGTVSYFKSLSWDSGGSCHPGYYCDEWLKYGELNYGKSINKSCVVVGNIYQ